jgi:putative copper export protein
MPIGNEDEAARLFCIFTAVEIALGVIVICVVAVLGQLEPVAHANAMG